MIHWLAHKLGLKNCPGCDTLVEYAMDGLPEGQQDTVRQHLADCPPCREQVRDYWQVREGLGLCSQQHEAPPDICDKVLARLNEKPSAPEGAAVHWTPPVQARRHLGGWPRFWMVLGPAFACLSLVMTLVAFSALMSGKASPPPASGNELSSMADALMGDPHAAHVVLSAAGPASSAAGLLVLSPGKDRAYFHGDNLAPCPLGVDYVLWLKPQGGQARRLARFTVEAGGSCAQLLQLDGPLQAGGPVDFMVTRQDDAAPAGQAWLKGSVSL